MDTVTTVTGDTVTVDVTVAAGFRSATTVAFSEEKDKVILVCCVCVRLLHYRTVHSPATVTEGEGALMESGLEVSVREEVVERAGVGEAAAVLAVVLILLELAAGVTPTLAPVPPAPPTRRGLSSDCWMIFTPSGLLQEDSRVLAL